MGLGQFAEEGAKESGAGDADLRRCLNTSQGLADDERGAALEDLAELVSVGVWAKRRDDLVEEHFPFPQTPFPVLLACCSSAADGSF